LRGAAGALAYIGREYELARMAIDRAVALNPNSAAVLGVNGWVRLYLGDLPTATESFEKALRLSPLDPEKGFILSGLSAAHLRAGRFEEGLTAGLSGLREMPKWTLNFQTAICCLAELNRLDEARGLAGKLLYISPGYTIRKFVNQVAIPNENFRRASADALRAAGISE
jgi:adenylate cyclase